MGVWPSPVHWYGDKAYDGTTSEFCNNKFQYFHSFFSRLIARTQTSLVSNDLKLKKQPTNRS